MKKLSALLLLLASLAAVRTASAVTSVPLVEYHQRRVALGDKLKGGATILFADEAPLLDLMPYRQNEDFYYLTGLTEPGAALLIIGPGPGSVDRLGSKIPDHAYREILFLPIRNLVTEKYTGEKLDAASPASKQKTGFDEVMPLAALPDALGKFLGEDRRRATDLYTQSATTAATAALQFTNAVIGSPARSDFHDIHPLIAQLRIVKSPAEIELLRKAADASIAGHLAGMKAIKPGAKENTVGGLELYKSMEMGCERPSYAPIVGSGINSTRLHYSANTETLQAGDLVVIDEACEYSMYASDITRTMPISGKFTPRQREIYEIVLGAQRAAIAAFVAGKFRMGTLPDRTDPKVADSLDKVAYEYINTHGKDLHGQPLGQYFLHSLGHSVGIGVHDPTPPGTILDKGMVFTIEPGIYIPEEKIGVRIEDTFYVDQNGKLIDYMAKLPHTAEEVEAAMR